MKKFILLFLLAFSAVVASAQSLKFNAYELSYRYVDGDGEWSEWSDWEKTSILVIINLDEDLITVYSQKMQKYNVKEYVGENEDSDGNSMTFNCVNDDGVNCNIRIRAQKNGVRQLYVDFEDFSWVYNLDEKSDSNK